jgi:hypothetical protein
MVKPNENRLFPPLHHHARAQFDCVLAEPMPEGWSDILRQIQDREAAALLVHDNQMSAQRAARHKRS